MLKGLEPKTPAFLVPMLSPLSHGCQWQNLKFYPYSLSDLEFTPLPSQASVSLHPHSLDACLTYGNSCHSDFALQRSFVDFSWRRATDEDCRCSRKFWTLYIFYWIIVYLKLPLAASISILLITIQYAVFSMSLRTFYVSLYILFLLRREEVCDLSRRMP